MAEPLPTAQRPDVVYRWDLDKTYLDTDFSSLRGLLRAAIESAGRRRTIAGMRALLTGLSHTQRSRVVVVSGSPVQLRSRILAMFALHGIRCDHLVLKDFSAALRRGRVRALTGQVPYKLRGHLDTRVWLAEQKADVAEVCFGDDAEVDALIYCLYADVCARRVSELRLAKILKACGAYQDEIAAILGCLDRVPRSDPVRRIFIHLEGNSPPSRYGAYRGRVVPTFNALQIALCLAQEGLCNDTVLGAVADELVREHRVVADGLAGSVEDAARRGLCSLELARRVTVDLLPRTAAIDHGYTTGFAARAERRLGSHDVARVVPTPIQPLPYEKLFEAEQAFARARRIAVRTAERIPGLADFLDSDDD